MELPTQQQVDLMTDILNGVVTPSPSEMLDIIQGLLGKNMQYYRRISDLTYEFGMFLLNNYYKYPSLRDVIDQLEEENVLVDRVGNMLTKIQSSILPEMCRGNGPRYISILPNISSINLICSK